MRGEERRGQHDVTMHLQVGGDIHRAAASARAAPAARWLIEKSGYKAAARLSLSSKRAGVVENWVAVQLKSSHLCMQ